MMSAGSTIMMMIHNDNDDDDDDIYRQYAGSEAWLERDLAAQVGTLLNYYVYVSRSFLFILNIIAGGNLAAAGHPQEAGAGGAGEARHH